MYWKGNKMILENDDFIQYQFGKKKLYGYVKRDKVVTQKGEEVEVNNAMDPETLNLISPSDIIANYGKEPDLETLKIETVINSYVVPVFGSVTEYRPVTEQGRKIIKQALAEVAEQVKDLNIFPTRIFIKFNKGKKVGCYKYNKKEDITEISLMPQAMDKDHIKNILLHELGHAVWTSQVPDNIKVKWIKLYDRNVNRNKAATTEVVNLRTDLINSDMKVNDYIKNMEDGSVLKKVMDKIKDLYNLKPQHIDLLIQQGNDLEEYWPKEGLYLTEYTPFVSEYATESVEEFFAESFMFFCGKENLPAIVNKALNYTVKNAGIQLNDTQAKLPDPTSTTDQATA